jgi:HSP20 family protein
MGEQKRQTTQQSDPKSEPRSSTQLPVTRRSGQDTWLERQGGAGTQNWYGASSPFSMMRRMMDDMDRMFEDFGLGSMLTPFGRSGTSSRAQTSVWSPQIEVTEHQGQLFVRADLPGLRKEDVELELEDDALVIRGHRQNEREESRGNVRYSERSYGRFSRAIALPAGIQPEQVEASFENGVLEISLKLPEASRRRIAIRSSTESLQSEASPQGAASAPSSEAASSNPTRNQPADGNQPRS